MIIKSCIPLLLLSTVKAVATPSEQANEESPASKATASLLADTPLDLLLSQSPSSLSEIIKAHLGNCSVSTRDPETVNEQLETVYEYIAHKMQDKKKGKDAASSGCENRVERDAMKLYKAIRTEHGAEAIKKLKGEGKLKGVIELKKDKVLTYPDTDDCRQRIHARTVELLGLTCDDHEWTVNRLDIERAARDYLERKKNDAKLTLSTFLIEHHDETPYIQDYEAHLEAAVQHQGDVPAAAHGHYLQITHNDDITEVERLSKLGADARTLEVLADVIKERNKEAMDYIWWISEEVQRLLKERLLNKKHMEGLLQSMLTVVKGELAQREELMSSMTERDAITFIDSLIHRQAYNQEDTRTLLSMDHRIRELLMAKEEPNIEKWAKEVYDKMMEHLGRWSWYSEEERSAYVKSFVDMHDPKAVEAFKAKLKSKILDMVGARKISRATFDVDQVETVDKLAKHVYDTWKDPPNFNQLNLVGRGLFLETMIPRPTNIKDARLVQIAARVAAERMLRDRFEMLKECDGKDASAPYFALLQTAVPITANSDAELVVSTVTKMPVSHSTSAAASLHPHAPNQGRDAKGQQQHHAGISQLSGSCKAHVKHYLTLQVREGIFQQQLTQNVTPIMLRANNDAQLAYKHMLTHGIDSVDTFVEGNLEKEPMSYKHLVKVQALNLYRQFHK